MSKDTKNSEEKTKNCCDECGCESETLNSEQESEQLAARITELEAQLEDKSELLFSANSVVEKQSEKINELNNALLRERADFDNYRKRTALQNERIREDASADVLIKFIPVLDVITQALGMIADEKVAAGVRMIHTQISDLFTAGGVCEIDALGKPFDPMLHNAMMQVKVNNPDQVGIVVEVFQKGYKMGEKILRHSVVKVGC